MTQARRAQRHILAHDRHHPRQCDGFVGLKTDPDGTVKCEFADKSMIVYAPGSHWPDVWTVTDRVRKKEYPMQIKGAVKEQWREENPPHPHEPDAYEI